LARPLIEGDGGAGIRFIFGWLGHGDALYVKVLCLEGLIVILSRQRQAVEESAHFADNSAERGV
jgi:hypothetical protein